MAIDIGKGSSSYALNGNDQENGRAMLTVTQVADALNVHPHSVRRWADSGMLPCYRIGVRGDRRFNPQDVQVFLES